MYKKKILIVYHGLRNIGGGEKSLLEFFNEINGMSYSVALLYSNQNIIIDSLSIKNIERIQIPGIFNRHRSKVALIDYFLGIPELVIYLKNIYKYINNNKYDYIYIHDNFNKVAFGLLSFFVKINIVCHLNDVLKYTFLDRFLRFLYLHRFAKFVAVSFAAKNSVKFGELNSCKVIYPFPSISPPIWVPRPVNFEFTLLTVGVLDYVKGQDVVINALSLLKSYKPNYKITYHIVGDGIERDSLHHLINKMGLSESVILHGRVEDLSTYFENANAVIIPSRQESFGLSYVEALMRGVPVIYSDVDALKELASKVSDAPKYFFSSGDFLSCAEAIASLIDNYDDAVQGGLSHRHKILSIKEYPHVKSINFLFQ